MTEKQYPPLNGFVRIEAVTRAPEHFQGSPGEVPD